MRLSPSGAVGEEDLQTSQMNKPHFSALPLLPPRGVVACHWLGDGLYMKGLERGKSHPFRGGLAVFDHPTGNKIIKHC
jgi:hypothetical protein